MKRLSIILNVALLSLLIIVVGGGVTLSHCMHTGNVSVVQLSMGTAMEQSQDDAEEGQDCGMASDCHCSHSGTTAIGELPCMNYTLLSCQPTIASHGFDFSASPLCVQLPPFMESAVEPVWLTVARQRQTECSGRHGPPRDYLRLITVLQI